MGYDINYHKVNGRKHKIRDYVLVVGVAYLSEGLCKVNDGDKAYNGCFFDKGDKFVTERRHNVFNSLGDNYLYHRRGVIETESTGSFELTGVNRLNTASHNFGNIRTAVHTENGDGNRNIGKVESERWHKYEITDKKLNHDRRSAEEAYVYIAYERKYLGRCLILGYHFDNGDNHTDEDTDDKAENGYLNSDPKTVQYVFITVIRYEFSVK